MAELPYIDTYRVLRKELTRLNTQKEKIKDEMRKNRPPAPSKKARVEIHALTGGHCHICAGLILIEETQADHVNAHSTGGSEELVNFLPVCKECNSYRWDYLPDEIKWILKIGVFAREQMKLNTPVGKYLGEAFIEKEKTRELRRKNPRKSIG